MKCHSSEIWNDTKTCNLYPITYFLMFTLHPQLTADTFFIHDLPLCRLLLMNDKRFPWLILVPRHDSIREIFELGLTEQQQLTREISEVAERLKRHTSAHKINIAALGNQVPQLHIHIIARAASDDAWPKPVWSAPTPPLPYAPEKAQSLVVELQRVFHISNMDNL